jgi:SAM-dependent methyltransferase
MGSCGFCGREPSGSIFQSGTRRSRPATAASSAGCATGREKPMIDHDNLEDFRDAETYDLQDEGYYDDYPLTEQWARSLGGPLLDLACGTGRMALRMAALGYQVTGVDITPEMIARARQKAAQQGVSIEWVVADARTFHLQQQFRFMYRNRGPNALVFQLGDEGSPLATAALADVLCYTRCKNSRSSSSRTREPCLPVFGPLTRNPSVA